MAHLLCASHAPSKGKRQWNGAAASAVFVGPASDARAREQFGMKRLFPRMLARTVLVAASAAAVSGCISTSSVSTTLLALPPVASRPPADAASSATPRPPLRVLVLRRVDIPEYLQARAVRYRLDETRLETWPQTAWAERLEVSMTRAIVDNLRQRLRGWAVCEGSCANLKPDLAVTVDFGALDYYVQGPRLDARARWVLRTTDEPVRLTPGRWQAPADLTVRSGVGGQAEAFGAAAQGVAAAIAGQLDQAVLPPAANQPIAGTAPH